MALLHLLKLWANAVKGTLYYVDCPVKKQYHQKPCENTCSSDELSEGANLEKEKCEVVQIIKRKILKDLVTWKINTVHLNFLPLLFWGVSLTSCMPFLLFCCIAALVSLPD